MGNFRKEIPKFSLGSSSAEILEFFNESGFAVFECPRFDETFEPILKDLNYLADCKLQQLGAQTSSNKTLPADQAFIEKIVKIHSLKRSEFVSLMNCSHSLPSLMGLIADSWLNGILRKIGYEHVSVNWLPRVRMDFPFEDEFGLPDHQDRHFNGGSENAVTLWLPLVDVSMQEGPLQVRYGSHKLGSLENVHLKERPYIKLQDGAWNDLPIVDVEMKRGEVILFHMDLIHRSGKNVGANPRVSLQFRYNRLDDREYQESGWPLTYKLLAEKDKSDFYK